MLNNLSYRIKTPAAVVLVILLTATSVSFLLVWQGWREARQSFESHAHSLGRVLAQTARPALLRDDIWQAYEILITPLEGRNEQAGDYILLDTRNRVFAASNPKLYPVLSNFPMDGFEHGASHALPATYEHAAFLYLTTPVKAEDGTILGQLMQRHNLSVLKPHLDEIALRVLSPTLAVLALLLPLGWLAGKRLTEPLSHLAQCLMRVGRENPDAIRCEFPDGRDEISVLAKSFHGMVDELRTKQALEKHLAQTDRLAAIGRLTAGIAHEVNNPLGGMLNAISNQRRAGIDDARSEKTLSLIERGLTQIRTTVSALLVEARLESHAMTPEDVEDVRTLVAAELPERRIRLDWDNRLATPVALPSAQVRQIMLNLLLNAIHAAAPGGTVDFSLKALDASLVMQVGNGGAEIPPRRREHLFEPFFGEGEGHGLGLWVTYQLVQQMGGRIEVKSMPGATCFTVTLPLGENHHER